MVDALSQDVGALTLNESSEAKSRRYSATQLLELAPVNSGRVRKFERLLKKAADAVHNSRPQDNLVHKVLDAEIEEEIANAGQSQTTQSSPVSDSTKTASPVDKVEAETHDIEIEEQIPNAGQTTQSNPVPDSTKVTSAVDENKAETLDAASSLPTADAPVAATKKTKKAPKAEVADEGEALPEDFYKAQPGDPNYELTSEEEEEPKEKKKKNKKPNKKSTGPKKPKLPPASGFEEFYADPPLTPQEYMEEIEQIYAPSRPFVERIEQCMQRYRARRKLDSERSHIFTKYLLLGGVDATPKPFGGGLDKETVENSTAQEIADINARDYIQGNPNSKFFDGNMDAWEVNFELVVAGFIAEKLPAMFGDEGKTIKQACDVLRNWLNYVLHHNVCPEYKDNILAARRICDIAEEEFEHIREVAYQLPGAYNTACSTLFGGQHFGLGPDTLSDSDEDEKEAGFFSAMNRADALQAFKTAAAMLGTDEQCQFVLEHDPKIVDKQYRGFEIVDIIMPTDETKAMYAATKNSKGETGTMQPLGIMRVKPWSNPAAAPEDVTDSESEDGNDGMTKDADGPIEEFWLEQSILEEFFKGMRFEADVRQLDCGFKYFDTVTRIYPSFYTYLQNEKMEKWKQPRPNDRPAPNVDDEKYQDGQSKQEVEAGAV